MLLRFADIQMQSPPLIFNLPVICVVAAIISLHRNKKAATLR
jgi:hypothetical protein